MLKPANLDIREQIKGSNLSHWMVAEALGVHETTFVRWLRRELPNDKKSRVLCAISKLKNNP